MFISCNWLRDFVELPSDLDPRALADRLTITMAEVESVEHHATLPPDVHPPGGAALDRSLLDDWVIEIDNKSITHRPDLWGHYGVAREVAAMFGRPLKSLPVVDMAELSPAGLPEIPIVIDDPARCPRYSALRMEALGAQPSPPWMQLRLARVGQRPISLLVDLTNYIMCELGQPMHAFDAAKLARIEVADASAGEKFRTLDNVERVMPPGTLMIQSGRKSVAIAGIMGGAATEVTPATREILLESANFEPATVRRAAAAMSHRTEASARFEKSLDPNLTVQAIARFVHLARAEYPQLKLTSRLSDCHPRPLTARTIELRPDHAERIIGQTTSRERIVSILRPLGFDVQDRGAVLAVTPPSYRATKDISIEADLIEEVARSVGYDHIEPTLPRVAARPLDASAERVLERRSLELFCVAGPFVEVHGYIWFDDEWLARLGHDPGPCVRLRNPVAPQSARLRRTLLPGLLAACDRNRYRQASFDLVEVGSVFAPAGGRLSPSRLKAEGDQGGSLKGRGEGDSARADPVLAAQQRCLALAVVRSGANAEEQTWRLLKSHAETWAEQIARMPVTYSDEPAARPWEDAQRCCTLLLGGRPIGRAGLVPLSLRLKLDERMRNLSIGLLELELTGLDVTALPARKLPAPPVHPEVQLDFSFLADARRRYAQLAEDLRAFSDPLLRRLHFVDSFEGGSIPAGRRSFTIRAVIGDASRTLDDGDLSRFGEAFRAFLTKLGLELRG